MSNRLGNRPPQGSVSKRIRVATAAVGLASASAVGMPDAAADASGCALAGTHNALPIFLCHTVQGNGLWVERAYAEFEFDPTGASCNHQNKFTGTLQNGNPFSVESGVADNCGWGWSHAGWKTIQKNMKHNSAWCARARSSLTNNVYSVQQCHNIHS